MSLLFASGDQSIGVFSISPSNEYSGLISFRIDWFDLLAVQGTLKSFLQHHSSILWCSTFFMVQLWHPYMTTGKTIALTKWTFVSKVHVWVLLLSPFCRWGGGDSEKFSFFFKKKLFIIYLFIFGHATRISLVAQTVGSLPAMRETWVRSLGQEDPLEEEMVTHSSILAWKIPWTEKPGRLQSMRSQRVGHDWVTSPSTFDIHNRIVKIVSK